MTMVGNSSKRVRTAVLCVVAAMLLAVVVINLVKASTKPPKPIVHKDLYYVDGSTNPFQTLDLYLPGQPSKQKLPLVIMVHGGAWVAGDKNHIGAGALLLPKGFAVASLNYRLAQNAPHPAQINDCKAAIRWLRSHATEYNIDPNRFGCWGHSAGGHLAALVGTTGDIDEVGERDQTTEAQKGLEKTATVVNKRSKALSPAGGTVTPSSVQAVCDWAGPTDLTSIASQAGPDSRIDFHNPGNPVAVLLAGKTADTCPDASPIFFLSADDPPMLLVHGEKDDVVPAAQSRELYERAQSQGAAAPEVQLLLEPAEGHALSCEEAVTRSVEFFENKLIKNYQPQPK